MKNKAPVHPALFVSIRGYFKYIPGPSLFVVGKYRIKTNNYYLYLNGHPPAAAAATSLFRWDKT